MQVAGFLPFTEAIYINTAGGIMKLQLVVAFADFKRAVIRERTRAGLEAVRLEDRIGDRHPKLRPDQSQKVADNALYGRKTDAQMVKLYSVSPATLSRKIVEKSNTLK